jgi:GNAT superfamily N-acetyltransferase
MELDFLAYNKGAIPTIAKWYFEEWCYLMKENSLDEVKQNLHIYLNTDKIPLIILAKRGEEVLGVAQLKFREMDIYPEKEHWLGGVYVAKEHRGNRIAEKIILEVIRIAKKLGVHKLHLQTEDLSGGLYSRLGWEPIEQVNYRGNNVLVMEKTTDGVSPNE